MGTNKYEAWEAIKEKYPCQWVIMRDAKFADPFHVKLLGGVVMATAKDQDELWVNMPRDYDGEITAEHTGEGVGANGLLMSGV